MSEQSLGQMSRPALLVELNERKRQLEVAQTEIMRAQVISAVRLDTIRLLGFIMNRGPSPAAEPEGLAPAQPEVRSIMAAELVSLANHLRKEASLLDARAEQLQESAKSDSADA